MRKTLLKKFEYRPEWHSDDIDRGTIKVIMTSAASDPPEFQRIQLPHLRKSYLQRGINDVEDELKLLLFVILWLTGFDVPCLHTMYVDKPMSGQNLMQAITLS